jgi:hypothetical protein
MYFVCEPKFCLHLLFQPRYKMPSWHALRRLPEMTAIIKTGCLFFQTAGQPLEQVTVKIISDSECIRIYDSSSVTDRMICAGDANVEKGASNVRGS